MTGTTKAGSMPTNILGCSRPPGYIATSTADFGSHFLPPLKLRDTLLPVIIPGVF